MMKRIALKFYSDSERPKEKGYYLTVSKVGTIQEIFYDPKLGEWNCYTEEHVKEVQDNPEAFRYNVIAWADSRDIHKLEEEYE